MDLKSMGKALASTSFNMHVLDPEGLPLYAIQEGEVWGLTTKENDKPVIWNLVGQDSPEWKRGQAAIFNWNQKNSRKKVKFSEAAMKRIETVAAGVTGWQNTVWDGELLEFSIDNLIKVLQGYSPSLEQTDETIGDRGNFFSGG